MNRIVISTSDLLHRNLFQTHNFPCLSQCIREKSKKAQSSKRNPTQAPGKHWGLKIHDGDYVKKDQILATQNRLRYHGGLNVGVRNQFILTSLAEGTVIITCEKPDVDWSHSYNQKFYSGLEGVTFYKKYLHVIPKEPHIRFKVVDLI